MTVGPSLRLIPFHRPHHTEHHDEEDKRHLMWRGWDGGNVGPGEPELKASPLDHRGFAANDAVEICDQGLAFVRSIRDAIRG